MFLILCQRFSFVSIFQCFYCFHFYVFSLFLRFVSFFSSCFLFFLKKCLCFMFVLVFRFRRFLILSFFLFYLLVIHTQYTPLKRFQFVSIHHSCARMCRPMCDLTLAQGRCKGCRFIRIFRHGTERGADVAVEAARTSECAAKVEAELQKMCDSILTTTDEIGGRMWFGRFVPQEGETTIVSGTKTDSKEHAATGHETVDVPQTQFLDRADDVPVGDAKTRACDSGGTENRPHRSSRLTGRSSMLTERTSC